MRKHGINLPQPTASGAGATLDFKGIDVKSAKYQAATKACAAKLVGKLGGVSVTGIHIKGIHLKSIPLGKYKIPAIKLPPITLKNIPTPNTTGSG